MGKFVILSTSIKFKKKNENKKNSNIIPARPLNLMGGQIYNKLIYEVKLEKKQKNLRLLSEINTCKRLTNLLKSILSSNK